MTLLIKNVVLKGKRIDIFIRDGKIEEIGSKINKVAAQRIDGEGRKAVLPGLVNAHTHAAMSLFRGYGGDLPLNDWLEKKIWPVEKKLSPDDVYWGTKLACLEMIKTGTTCFNDMYWFPSAALEAIEETGLRAVVGLVILDDFPFGSRENVEKFWRNIEKRDIKEVSFALAPHAVYSVSQENLIWTKNFAQANNLPVHIHLSETQKEVSDCLKKYKLRPAEYLAKIGILNKNCLLAHAIWLSDKEIKLLAEKKCNLIYSPCSEMKLASGVFPYLKVKQAKVNVCLGTDSSASNDNLDLFEEMKFASLLQKIKEMDPLLAPSSEIFALATENSGRALKMKIGRIERGYFADLILVDLGQICFSPGHNLISNLVYSCHGDCVTDVVCAGKILMRNRKVEKEKEIIKEAAKRAKRLFNLGLKNFC